MILRSFSIALAALFGLSLVAQEVPDSLNMIENGSFEQLSGKLKRLGGIDAVAAWGSPTDAKADIYSETVDKDGPAAAPKNANGFQSPLSGLNYAGLLWWSYGNKEPRSYLQVKFKKMLKKDQRYCIRYYVSLSDLSKYSSDQLGAYVSRIIINKKADNSLTYVPQVPDLKTKVYDDMNAWVGVCGVYEAKGDEQYLLIGNFASNDKTNTLKNQRPKGEVRPQKTSAYYYIDDVSVTAIKNMSECSCDQLDKTESEFIYSRKMTADPNMKPAARVEQSTVYFKRYSAELAPSMKHPMEELITGLKADPNIRVRLTGHMDATEVDRVRMRPDLGELDTERAETVKAALVAAGIAADRITVAGGKGDDPANEGMSEVAMSQNRRVEVDVVK